MPLTKINNRSLSGALTPSAMPSGSIIQSDSMMLKPGVDFNNDNQTSTTSYINLAGDTAPNRVLQVSLNNVQSTSVLKFHYQVGLTYNVLSGASSWAMYNIWETNAQKYVVNSTDFAGANSDSYIAGVWSSTQHSGLFGFAHTTDAGQFSGNCTFQLRFKTSGTASWHYHWHGNRIPHTLSVLEIKA